MKSSEMKKATKRILAMLLCTSMVLGSGVSASADEGMAAVKEQGHVHTETCYEKNKTDNLICTKAEAAEGHVHGDACYEVTSSQELTCTQAETAGHTHDDGCMETTKNLTCGAEEHTHGGDCYKTETKDVCSDESEEHTCGDGCVETEEVLKCEKSEHTHDDGCYESVTKMVCDQNEVEAHTHGEGCYTTAENKTLKCTLEEVEAHTHNDDCYAWEEKLVCTLPETAPAAEQPEKEEEAAEVNLQNDDETGIKVSVKSTSDVVPEDTKVVVAPMEMDEEHETALAEAVGEFEVLGYTAYDISLKDAEDEDITLGENKVEVAIDFEELIPEGINAEEVKDVVLVHITTDEEDKLTAEAVGTVEITEDKATVEFEADSFSPYVITYLGETEEAVEEVVVEEPVVEDITLTYTSEDEAYTVTVTGTPEVLGNVTAFEAVQVADEEKITALTEQLTAKAAEAQKTSLGFENYEFKFLDAEGNEVSVNGEVKVSLSFAEERIPEAATAENVDAVDAALLKTGTDDKGEAVLEEMNGLVSAEAGAVKEVVYTTEAPEELILAWSGDVYRTLPNYEDDEVVITLAGTEYALQNVVGFNVTPIKEDNEETKEQYAEVAKQLEEKIAEENEEKEEEKSVVGFLAYDITLVDAEGNELEPQGGVRVSMEYKEAAAPEAVAETEEAEVTIHHFEEDETGEVKQIVDMVAEETIEAEVTTTGNVEVEKAEFVTDSFSTYTITWTVKGKDEKITAQVVNERLESIAGTNDINITKTLDGEYTFEKECKNLKVNGKTYVLKETIYKVNNNEQVEIDKVRYYRGNFQYGTITTDWTGREKTDWKRFETPYSLYLVYVEAIPITTVDSTKDSINIDVFDYSNWQKDDDKVLYWDNNKHSFRFVNNGDISGEKSLNKWTNTNGGPRQGIVNNKLTSAGALTLSGNHGGTKNESLEELFDKDSSKKYDANYLFVKENGYYVYDSMSHYAELDTTTSNFTVYNYPSNVEKGFFPFNEIGTAINESGSDSSVTNHHYGMHIDFSFMQPKSGLPDGDPENPMIFEFSGDDDVWVFIDGMLVLDLGGIHTRTGGTINFATGQVTYDNTTLNKTIYEMFESAGCSNEQLSSYFVRDESTGKYRFRDYSQHKLDFFYLERGADKSNCMIKFNLISIPEDSITIKKQIVNYATGAYSDVEFSFEMYLQRGEKDSQKHDPNDPVDEKIVSSEENIIKYEHIAADGETKTVKELGKDGIFKLKHKEQAIFSHMLVNTEFYVVETAISQDAYDEVKIEGLGVLNEQGASIQEGQESISTKTLVIGTDVYAEFQNQCAATNLKHLVVQKKLNGTVDDNDNATPTYQMQVTVAGQPYKGKYRIGDDYQSALEQGNSNSTVDGKISLPAGKVAVIMGYVSKEINTETGEKIIKYGIPSGTSFEVKEIGLNYEVYAEPTYSVVTEKNRTEENKDYNATKVKDSASTPSVDYGAGEIVLDGNAKVIVTNALKSSLTITKEWVSNVTTHTTPVQVGLYRKSDSTMIRKIELNTNNNYSVTIPGLSASDYIVKELAPVTDENPEITIGTQGYKSIESGGNIVIDGDTYKVTYSKPDDDVITITNTQLAQITINKVSASDTRHKLNGAKFEIYKWDTAENEFVKIDECETKSNGELTFDKLEKGGIYQVTETVAPHGYSLLGNSIYFKVKDNLQVELTDSAGNPINTNDIEMWSLDGESNKLTVKNNCLYSLPSTGGHGIYTTMLSGFALMLGAAYVWFTSRREESSNN